MALLIWSRDERRIRKVLRRLARQRVALILQPGDVWVVERAVSERDEQVAADLRTCYLRGWTEVVTEAVPMSSVDEEGNLPERIEGVAPVYRLTKSGWDILDRTRTWLIGTFFVALATLVFTVMTRTQGS